MENTVISLRTVAPHLFASDSAKEDLNKTMAALRALGQKARELRARIVADSDTIEKAETLFDQLTALGLPESVLRAAIAAQFPAPAVAATQHKKGEAVSVPFDLQMEILSAVPREGISRGDLEKRFSGRASPEQILLALKSARSSGDVTVSGVTKGTLYHSK